MYSFQLEVSDVSIAMAGRFASWSEVRALWLNSVLMAWIDSSRKLLVERVSLFWAGRLHELGFLAT